MKRSQCALVALLAFFLAGCDSSANLDDLQTFMDEVIAQPKGAIEAMPKEVVYEPFTYMAADMRSPFQPPMKANLSHNERGHSDIKPDETRVKQFLEGFNIESFVMVGTLANSTNTYALLRGTDAVYRVRVGDYLGSNNGRITAITASSVAVIEVVSEGDGRWLERPRTLTLQEGP